VWAHTHVARGTISGQERLFKAATVSMLCVTVNALKRKRHLRHHPNFVY